MRSIRAMRVLSAAMVVAAVAGCAKEKPFRCTPETVLPEAVHAHPWTPAGEPEIYTAVTLEEYIDGGARPYLEYGMRRLIHAIYEHKASPDRRMVVDVYEMASPLAAYGIYSIQRPQEAEEVNFGTAGFWSDGLLCFVKDRIYVAVQSPGESPRDMASAMLIGGYVDSRITLPSEPPAMIGALPSEDRIKHSEKYLAQDMLGHRFLGGGWQATYRYRGVTHELFVIPCRDAAEAVERYEKLTGYVAENGKVLRRVKGIGRAAMIATGKSLGRLFLTCSGKHLVGTIDCFDDDRSVRLSREVIEHVTRKGL